jgi:hypothetical protein
MSVLEGAETRRLPVIDTDEIQRIVTIDEG